METAEDHRAEYMEWLLLRRPQPGRRYIFDSKKHREPLVFYAYEQPRIGVTLLIFHDENGCEVILQSHDVLRLTPVPSTPAERSAHERAP